MAQAKATGHKASEQLTAVRNEMDTTRSLVIGGELVLYGIVDSMDDWAGGTIRAVDVMASLTELADQKTIVVRLNSPGGSVLEGIAIYNALLACGKPIEIRVDAYAGSIASVIAMAGSRIIMASNAMMMIHDPYGVAMGGAEDLRTAADEIDRMKTIILNVYAKRTGRDPKQLAEWMSAETTMSAEEAIANGFADELDEPMRVAACKKLNSHDLALLLTPPSVRAQNSNSSAHEAAHIKETTMSDKTGASGLSAAELDAVRNEAVKAERDRRTQIVNLSKVAGVGDKFVEDLLDGGFSVDEAKSLIATEVKNKANAAPPINLEEIKNQERATERDRVQGILTALRLAKLDASVGDDLIKRGVALDKAKEEILNMWAQKQEDREDNPTGTPGGDRVKLVTDGVERWAKGAEAGLLARINLKGGERNEFTGLTLTELARSSLEVRNIKAGSMDRMKMVGTAFTVKNAGPGYHSSSDFGNVLASVAYRSMMTGYEEVDETFPLWTGKGTVSDFRPATRVDMGLFPALDKVEEGAEYKYATIGDTGTVVQVATYGKMFAITRQAVINDDLQFFDRVPRRMGRAAKRTIGNLVYAIINGNPTMQDSIALFHASHGNLATVAAVPSVTSIGAGVAAMAVQKDDGGVGTGGGASPKFMLVPPALGMTTNTVVTSQFIPGDAAQVSNPIRGIVDVITDSRLSGTAWYLAAAPGQTDTIEISYLDGVEEPFLDQKEGWDVDGTEFKVRMDAGVKALHWRGLYKNAGV